MAGKAKAVSTGLDLRRAVAALGAELGLEVREEVQVGRRIWGAKRRIDVVLRDRASRLSLGIECKYQGENGSAEEKIPATISDIEAWPIRGLVVFDGPGFSSNMRSYLFSTGKAVQFQDLREWLGLFFGV